MRTAEGSEKVGYFLVVLNVLQTHGGIGHFHTMGERCRAAGPLCIHPIISQDGDSIKVAKVVKIFEIKNISSSLDCQDFAFVVTIKYLLN